MALPLVQFESERVKKESRKMLKEARNSYLEKVKDDYEKDRKKKEKIKARGEDKWMLPSVDQRIEKDQQLSKSKKKKKEKKKKKHKEKKSKKHKHREDSSSSDSDESVDQWVEKGVKEKNAEQSESLERQPLVIKGPTMERDSWMTAPVDMFPTVTRQELRDKRKKEEEEKDGTKVSLFEKPGGHERELNPYWKDGGTGLPEEETKMKKSAPAVGDGGLSWLKRAYNRCVQKSKDEGITLEQAAEETWGSLKKLEKMLKSAEKMSEKNDKERDRYKSSYDRDRGDSHRSKQHFHKPGSDNEEYSDIRRSRTSGGDCEKYDRKDRKEDYHESRQRSRDRDHNYRYEHSKRSRDSRSRSKERIFSSEKYEKRSQDRNRQFVKDKHSTETDSRRKFVKPGHMESEHSKHSHRRDEVRDRNYCPSWKKREFMKSSDKDDNNEMSHDNVDRKKERNLPEAERRKSSSSSSSDSSSDSSDDSLTEEKKEDQPVKPVTILTEDQLNQLSAKILKAEIMGDEELVTRLKVELEEARKLREEHKDGIQSAPGSQQSAHVKEDEDVLLTITDRRGMVRPVQDRQHPVEPRGGRRKKQKVTTHDSQGQRERYFDDDDRFDLKKLVEREKMGSAEDQNRMFARLAGRIAEKTDEDYQMDDVLITKSAQKQSDSRKEERERSMAIFEHKKVTAAIERCQFCFDNVAKHLIIAIGLQAYLCLPSCVSLTEGHCLIVPMTHVSAGTAMDEDVWSEIQVFRKALTRMFADRELDVVFMEMSTNLKKFPHMCLECVPMPKEVGDMAPIYFKKALLESDTEWSQNKKLVDLSQKNVRRSIPKGLPYFSVDFGLQGGFAHVIEAEHLFPYYFGKEIIGGMLDAEHRLWRRPPRENFDDQRKKVLAFAEWWKPYDWTMKINKDD